MPGLDLQPHVGSCHAVTIQKPLKVVYSTLGTPHSIESLENARHPTSEACSVSTLSTSGYAADEESSRVSLLNKEKTVKLTKQLTTQVDGTQSSDVFTFALPSPLKIQNLIRKGQGIQQAGGEK